MFVDRTASPSKYAIGADTSSGGQSIYSMGANANKECWIERNHYNWWVSPFARHS